MKVYCALATLVAIVLGWAAVWIGGLNQDEGWYLYAANMVAEGHLPFRDFFFTQGPIMPIVYSFFTGAWTRFGLLGARVYTLIVGFAGIVLAMALAHRRAADGNRVASALMVAFLLGTNIYHLYYLAIPKTYALASLFVIAGFLMLSLAEGAANKRRSAALALAGGMSLAFAAGTRISLGAILAVVGVAMLCRAVRHRDWTTFLAYCVGGAGALALVYGPFVIDAESRSGLLAAQAYHAARGGFDPVWTVGSLSRLVRWYLPTFIVFGLAIGRMVVERDRPKAFEWMTIASFGAVFAVQMLAPFPYEDYQVPVMALMAVFSVVTFANPKAMLLVLGLAFATSFGSPLLEKWSTNGQDRFWSRKKAKTELAQLRDVARRIERLDPGGKELLTQDLYLAIETNRKVPRGFEMGPFSFWGDSAPNVGGRACVMTDATMRELIAKAPCEIAALSGYSFAITAPKCDETPVSRQIEYWNMLKGKYALAFSEEDFGQNATTLLVLRRK